MILPPHQLFSASSAPTLGTKYPLYHFISYNRYSPSHLCYIANVSRDEEPPSYELAMTDPKWQEVMNSELKALIDNQTWSFVPLPPGKRPISCKWVIASNARLTGLLSAIKLTWSLGVSHKLLELIIMIRFPPLQKWSLSAASLLLLPV